MRTAIGRMAGPLNPPTMFESFGRRVSTSIAIARNVLTSDTASSPASSAALAIDATSVTFGCSLHGTFDVVSAVRKVTRLPVIPKLTPNVTDVASFAKASEDAGADAVSLVNTFLAMAIDVETRRPNLSNVMGGLSGPAIRPIAVRMVYECHRAVKIPVIGMGGIASARDALEFMIAGATAVQVGTANFVDPFIWTKLVDGIRDYLSRHRIDRLADLVGTIDTSAREKQWVSS